MKVGDYVRTDDGLIGKVVSEPYEYKDSIGCDIDFGNNDIYNEYEMYQVIIKSSPNIIDLIEVGDYVNGCYVDEVFEYEDDTKGITICDASHSVIFNDEKIKSIVTKEQFENMEHKVKELD